MTNAGFNQGERKPVQSVESPDCEQTLLLVLLSTLGQGRRGHRGHHGEGLVLFSLGDLLCAEVFLVGRDAQGSSWLVVS